MEHEEKSLACHEEPADSIVDVTESDEDFPDKREQRSRHTADADIEEGAVLKAVKILLRFGYKTKKPNYEGSKRKPDVDI